MTVEPLRVLIAVVAVGVALGGLILTGLHGIRGELRDLRGEINGVRGEINGVRGEIIDLRQEMEARFSAMESRLSVVERQPAKPEGLREAITGHRVA